MRLSRGWLCAFFVVLTTLIGGGTAIAADGRPMGESLSSGLVIEGADLFLSNQAQAAEEARRANPEAIAARTASATDYEDLNTAGAEQLAGESFPALIAKPNGGAPQLPTGQRLTGLPTLTRLTSTLVKGNVAWWSRALPWRSRAPQAP